MITCGRCGEPVGIGGYGSHFRIYDMYACDGQKMAIRTDLCDDCQRQLKEWLITGGYLENKSTPLPVRTMTRTLIDLRSKLDQLINSLNDKSEKEE